MGCYVTNKILNKNDIFSCNKSKKSKRALSEWHIPSGSQIMGICKIMYEKMGRWHFVIGVALAAVCRELVGWLCSSRGRPFLRCLAGFMCCLASWVSLYVK